MSPRGLLPAEIHVHGVTGNGKCVLVREGHDDIDLSDILAISSVCAEVTVGEIPKVTLTVVARLVHNP